MRNKYGGVIVAALAEKLASGSGKTTLTAALLAHCKKHGMAPTAYKIGPDYLDGKIHARVTGRPCFNLDGFAMTDDTMTMLLNHTVNHGDVAKDILQQPRIIEGVMGLFDGARAPSIHGGGSSAELAKKFFFPLLLVVRQDEDADDIAASLKKIAADYRLLAVVINDMPSKPGAGKPSQNKKNTKTIWQTAWQKWQHATPLVFLPRQDFTLPHRHLGLHQAEEWSNEAWHMIEQQLLTMADNFKTAVGNELWQVIMDETMVRAPVVGAASEVASSSTSASTSTMSSLVPAPRAPRGHRLQTKAMHLAIAYDAAFGFLYPHHVFFWRHKNITLSFFSPLNNETPSRDATAIFLPGGYPELYLEKLSRAADFFSAMRLAAQNQKIIYGECGGFMMLGKKITDAKGVDFPALDLLPVMTSFSQPTLHLGYRKISFLESQPWQDNFFTAIFNHGDDTPDLHPHFAHEFHYCQEVDDNASREKSTPLASAPPYRRLFEAKDSRGKDMGYYGMVKGRVMGSFLHCI